MLEAALALDAPIDFKTKRLTLHLKKLQNVNESDKNHRLGKILGKSREPLN